ncbi:phosphate/phosphite/phosphonate ABC transporter substrate-binding protein [Desulfonatronovibrio hydrogenovorans]|uniref:phosphate/phosphite/phosphonate ABC transporter substrate-binding protein n=1 Tax=Desulfonatronovibrio hydrogenovorans TaxID=53245 RepID=UPI000490094A|nr:phosphate/phosphite/phosphonate ABC transporter substrate-binding protein [Desulfonatronovibrio hydrogenovorans]
MARKLVVVKISLMLFFLMFSANSLVFGCEHRGALDPMFCDEDMDLVADSPADPGKWKDPSTLIFTYTPVEDPAVYRDLFTDFLDYLSKATGKRVTYYTVHSNAAQIEAMRSGRLHVGGFSTGPTGFAVNLAGAVPFAVKGFPDGLQGYNLILVVRSDSPYQKPSDLKGKRVAHTSPSSNSGNLAPRILLPDHGLVPEQDYEVLFSGKHDQSVMGVLSGDYDAAPVASDVFDRMVRRGTVKEEDFRIIYRSAVFPTSSFAYAHDLNPDLVRRIVGAFHTYRFTDEMKKAFDGADRFYPITYKADWAVVRQIAEGTGVSYSRTGFEKEFSTKLQ